MEWGDEQLASARARLSSPCRPCRWSPPSSLECVDVCVDVDVRARARARSSFLHLELELELEVEVEVELELELVLGLWRPVRPARRRDAVSRRRDGASVE